MFLKTETLQNVFFYFKDLNTYQEVRLCVLVNVFCIYTFLYRLPAFCILDHQAWIVKIYETSYRVCFLRQVSQSSGQRPTVVS